MTVALVTDSTASLPPEVADECRAAVVPLQVVIDDESFEEGAEEASPACVAAALREKRAVSTSRPAPTVFGDLYRRLAEEGATEILSVHLSSDMSGTFESAQVAARHAPVPVTCIDTRQVGVGTGYAVESAAAVIAS
uniref:DegV family protein n=1 Tax=Nocardioides stalactiti TaxID=2755356 RepID=UPI0015FFC92B